MRSPASPRSSRAAPHGSALIFALCFVVVLAIAGIALVRLAGGDRTAAARLGVEDRGLSCAEAGLQYARRLFGTTYETSHGWNDYLADGSGYRYDWTPGRDAHPDLSASGSVAANTLGSFAGGTRPDYWVSIRDDDDERPMGIASDDWRHDNNEAIIVRSECINPQYAVTRGGVRTNVALESTLIHIQSSSGYGVTGPANAPDIVGTR
jgi:hypothetical protein